jgi:hypothetical protein
MKKSVEIVAILRAGRAEAIICDCTLHNIERLNSCLTEPNIV